MASDSASFGDLLPDLHGTGVCSDGLPIDASRFDSRLIVPIVVVLTFIAAVNTLQAFYMFFTGDHSVINFLRFLASNLFYSWYFIIPALIVRRLSTKVSLSGKSLPSWVSIHLSTLILLTIVHQTASLAVDRIVLGSRQSETLFSVLFNNPAIWGDFVAYILFLLGFYMIEYRKRDQENEVKYSRLEMDLVRANLHELRSRIHPQFLFNTLSEVSSLVHRKRDKEANRILSLLSDFLRTTVYENDREYRTVAEEVAFLDNYIAIEKAKFRDKLEVIKEIDDSAAKGIVPSFILQPIVEELVLRNLDSSGEPCKIQINITIEKSMLCLVIRGRRQDMNRTVPEENAGESIFSITRTNLEQIYQNGHEFFQGIDAEGWRVVRMMLPFRTSGQNLIPAGDGLN